MKNGTSFKQVVIYKTVLEVLKQYQEDEPNYFYHPLKGFRIYEVDNLEKVEEVEELREFYSDCPDRKPDLIEFGEVLKVPSDLLNHYDYFAGVCCGIKPLYIGFDLDDPEELEIGIQRIK